MFKITVTSKRNPVVSGPDEHCLNLCLSIFIICFSLFMERYLPTASKKLKGEILMINLMVIYNMCQVHNTNICGEMKNNS